MQKLIFPLVIFTFILASGPAQARNVPVLLPIANAMATPEAKQKLDNSVQFFFSSQGTPPIAQRFGDGISKNKFNSTIRSETDACNKAFVSALVELQTYALQLGANAVVNVVSYYRKREMSNPELFECHTATFSTVVTLKGEYVKLARRT